MLAKGVYTQRNLVQAVDLENIKIAPFESASRAQRERTLIEKSQINSLPRLPTVEPDLGNFYTKRD